MITNPNRRVECIEIPSVHLDSIEIGTDNGGQPQIFNTPTSEQPLHSFIVYCKVQFCQALQI